MAKKKYDYLVYIGRFQIPHKGHIETIKKALEISDNLIIVLGSHNKSVDWKNPWTTKERRNAIIEAVPAELLPMIYFGYVEDRLYQNKEWEASVYDVVESFITKENPQIGIIGFNKDESSFYLKSFNWDVIEMDPIMHNGMVLSASTIREALFNNSLDKFHDVLHESTIQFLETWKSNSSGKYITDWFNFDREYQKPYECLQYGTNFYCADNIIFQNGHILLIKRANHPGKGQWALPGGHIGNDETAFEAALRELREETGIKVPKKVLIGSFVGERIFDHPDRSLRGRCGPKVGRTISVSHCFVLDNTLGLPRVKGSDDASKAYWFNLHNVRKMREEIFEDHLDQINYWVAKIDDSKTIR